MNPLGITVNPGHPLPLWLHPTPTSRQKRANVSLFTCLEGGKTFPAPASWPALLQGVMPSNWVWFTLVSSFRHLLQVANICVGRIFPFSLLLSLFFFFAPVKCKFSRLARDEMLQAHVERGSCFNHRTFSLGLLQNDVYEITLLEIDGLLALCF